MIDRRLVYYEANVARKSRPYPGAVTTLKRLASQGATLAVCTNKREYLSRLLLQELDLEDHFSAIAGRHTFAVAKPDPDHLNGTIKLAGGDPSVGDSDVDVQTAKAAGVPVIKLGEHLVEIVGDSEPAQSLLDHDVNAEPTPERTVAVETTAWPRWVSTWFSAWVRSGVVSTRVPSRSKTMVAPFSIGVLSHAPCGHASGGVESAG